MLVTPRRRARWLAPLILVITTLVIAPSGLLMPVPARADTDLTIGGEARVSYANGDDVRVRDQPSYDGSILTTVPEGWLVAIHDGPIDDGAGSFWYEVTARGTRGYIVSDFLADAGSSADTSSGDEVTAAAVATVSVNLRLRSAASLAASILLVIPRGATVNTTGATDNGFTQLTYQGTTGWSSSQYISSGGGAVISNAWVTGGALNLRSSPTTASTVILVMPNAAQVGVLGSAQDGFTPVRYNGADGWAYSQFLTASQPGSGATSTPGTVIGNAWVVGGALNLRSGPSTSNTVLLVMPNSAQVGVTGSPQSGFTPVRYNGTDGWAYSQFLSSTAPGATATATSGAVLSNAWVTASGGLNLRSGPGTSNSVLRVIPNGAQVGVTGTPQSGYTPVRYSGTDGWVASQFLTATQPGASATPTSGAVVIGTQYTTASLNMRSGAGTSFAVLLVIPGGAEVGITGNQTNGFLPVRYNGTNGFASATYLSATPPGSGPSPTSAPGSGNTGGGIVWPVDGSTWEITQGYNGSSHINSSALSQYLYSFDLAREDRNTAGQPVYAPVSGTVSWTERASGGITINMGNGYAVAMFHVTVDRSWGSGDPISQGQYIGSISGPGGEGFVQFPHLHLTVWASSDGGGWSRQAVPFTGQNTISGQSFPDIGGTQQWTGTLFNP